MYTDIMSHASYQNHFEHLQDLIALTNAKFDAQNSGFEMEKVKKAEQIRSSIEEKAARASCFLPIEHIGKAFSLDEFSRGFISTLSAIEYARIHGDRGLCGSNGDDLIMLETPYAKFPPSRFMLSDAVFKYLIIEHEMGDGSWTALLRRRVMRFILNPDTWEDACGFELNTPDQGIQSPISDQNVYTEIKNLTEIYCSAPQPMPHIIWLHGAKGAGRTSMLKRLSSDLNISLLFIDCGHLPDSEKFEKTCAKAVRESLLIGAPLCFANADSFLKGEAHSISDLVKHIRIASGICFFISENAPDFNCKPDFTLFPIKLPSPDYGKRLSIWNDLGKPYGCDGDFQKLASSYALTPGQIKAVFELSHQQALAKGSGRISSQSLHGNCRALSAEKLKTLGHIVEPFYGWDDLILPRHQKDSLKSAAARLSNADKVFVQWGFEDKYCGKGLSMLFTGPPGTGKTMAAHAIAAELGLLLYRIDLSLTVSKYIGETEKNLKRIFDEAENSNCILFFDEADSLFGKRTEVKDSHDRHANMDVSYLLQRLETHGGITVLATNLVRNFDDAFKRRFQYIFDFSMPDQELRKEIWQSSMPEKAPLSEELDFDILSSFKLSGANIKNAALAAAFHAAESGENMGMKHIIAALKEENEKCSLGLDFERAYLY